MRSELMNVMELLTREALQDFENRYGLACPCQTCKTDILSLALNRIPPKYVSTNKGEVMVRALSTHIYFKQIIQKELVLASVMVEKNPRHEE